MVVCYNALKDLIEEPYAFIEQLAEEKKGFSKVLKVFREFLGKE